MITHSPRWAAMTVASVLLVLSGVPQPVAAQTTVPDPVSSVGPACTLKLGFATLSVMLPVQAVVGTCLENEYFNSLNGNSEQRTTRGLLYWRRSDNVTAFTDGYMTWLNGPVGIQARLNSDQAFDWEILGLMGPAPAGDLATTVVINGPAVPAGPSAPAPTPGPPSGYTYPCATRDASTPPITSGALNLRLADLTNADRRGAYLVGADFSRATLIGTDFTSATLSGASLYGADISRAVFFQADLRGVLAQTVNSNGGSTVPGPNFRQACLNGANFHQAKLGGSDFRNADLRNVDLSQASLVGSDLRGADLRYAGLSQTNFTGANVTGMLVCAAQFNATLQKGSLGNANFVC
jgi:Pentapeptide repeats (8 copies)